MESSCAKRVRRANYSQQEKNTLLTIVNKYKHIIENKKTDSVTNQEKERTWTKIATEFNAVAPANTCRDAQSLKKAYNNIKMQVRKEAADEKVQHFKTGGGGKSRGNPDNDGFRELALDTMNNKTVFGLPNLYDSDGVNTADTQPRTQLSYVLEYESADDDVVYSNVEEEADDAWENITPEKNNTNECVPETSTLNLTSKMKASDLPRPLHPALANKIQNTVGGGQKTAVEKANWTGRRRPNGGVALHSTELGKIYHQLGEERLEIAKKENLLLQKRIEHEDEIHKLKCDILRAELRQNCKE